MSGLRPFAAVVRLVRTDFAAMCLFSALVLGIACSRPFGIPPHALRGAPPPGAGEQALQLGAKAPPVLQARLPAVLVFYRGFW